MFVKKSTILLGFLFACILSGTVADERVVNTTNGQVRGLSDRTQRINVDYYSFRGIPYAKPPTGDLRFKAPQPIESWEPNVFDAFRYGSSCIQPNEFSRDSHPQNENCLFLNIFVPANVQPNEKLAVMLHIHGGGYNEGSGNNYVFGPDFLLENRVIVVTINYRLGVLGFLSLGLREYSGNMGLKDQQLALKWIFENINQFDGDNERITIFGQSAGASSVHCHITSAESRKYFQKAIVMSGSALHYWAMTLNNHVELAYEMADSWNQTQTNLPDLIQLFKTIPAEHFVDFTKWGTRVNRRVEIPFSPIVEDSDAIDPFMVQMPENAYKNSNIDKDVMFGVTSQEFLALHGSFEKMDDLQDQFNLVLPFRSVNLTFDSPEYRELSEKIRVFYFKNAAVDNSTREQYVRLLSDINMIYHSVKAAKIHAAQSNRNTFFYHCAFIQQSYEDVNNNKNDTWSRISLAAVDNLTKLFTNFAKYGQPIHNEGNLMLPPFESNQTYFVDINNNGTQIEKDVRKEAVDFWEDIERRVFN